MSAIARAIVKSGLRAIEVEKRSRLGPEVYDSNKGIRETLMVETSRIVGRQKGEALRLAVRQANQTLVNGDVIEFGTALGGTAMVLCASVAEANARRDCNDPPRKVFLLDSFETFPEQIHKIDQDHVHSQLWAEASFNGMSPKQLGDACNHFLPPELVVIVPGFYSDTVPKLHKETRFAVVHIDCDLYQSTIDALSPLFAGGMISRGGILMFDDWWLDGTKSLTGESAAWADLVDQFKIEYSNIGSYGGDGHKLIVHGYDAGA